MKNENKKKENMDSDIISLQTGIWQVLLFITKKSFIMKLLKMRNGSSK